MEEIGLYGEERRGSSGDIGRKDRGAQEEGGTEESLWLDNCCSFVVSQARAEATGADGGLEDPPQELPAVCPALPVASQCHRSCRPRALFLSPLLLLPPRDLTILSSLRGTFATSDFKEWLHIPSRHHHFRDPRQRDVTVVDAGHVLPWLRRELIYSLNLGANMCFGWPLEVALPETLLPRFEDCAVDQAI